MWTNSSSLDSAFNFMMILTFFGFGAVVGGLGYFVYWLFTHIQVV